MFNPEETQYEVLRRRGICRRDFLKFCSMAAVALGLGPMGHLEIAHAMETKPYLPVLWINGLSCSCCTESFIRSAHPLASDIILSMIALDYQDTIMAAAGDQAMECFEEAISTYKGRYILAVEGNPPLGEEGMYCIDGGRPFHGQTPTRSRRSQGHRRMGDLRLMGMRAGCPPQSDSGDPYPQSHSRQADHQGPGLPRHPGRYEQHRRLHPDL